MAPRFVGKFIVKPQSSQDNVERLTVKAQEVNA
jgi:hypothetical protein